MKRITTFLLLTGFAAASHAYQKCESPQGVMYVNGACPEGYKSTNLGEQPGRVGAAHHYRHRATQK